MKKIISILILVILIGILLCGCSHKTYDDDSKTEFYNKFVVIREDCGLQGSMYLMYDRNTKIIYLYIGSSHRAGLSPYYIVVDGEPTIAIYGVNYEVKEQNY